MILLPLLLLLRDTSALPSTPEPQPPTPSISHIAYGSPWYDVSCLDNGNAVTEILPVDPASGSYEMKYTLNNYSPWIDLENSVLRKYCKLNITIDVPEGWKVEVDRGGGMIDGYMALPAFGWGYIWLNYLYESTGINAASNVTFEGAVGKFERHTTVTRGPAVSKCGTDVLQTKFLLNGDDGDTPRPETPAEGLRWIITSPLKVLKCDQGS